jgi:hypothetical protein
MKRVLRWAGVAGGAALGGILAAQQLGYTDTPLIPGTKWRVHDGERPQPRVVTPGIGAAPPSDAVVLFDGRNLDAWTSGGKPAPWRIENGAAVVGGGGIETKQSFGDCQVHVEFATPNPPSSGGQGRGNSGFFLMGRYEIQILDSYENKTYPDGQAAALYGQVPPLVNASRPPGEWQSYDILWRAPRFADGKLVSPARITVLHNGVAVHIGEDLLGPMTHRGVPQYTPHPEKLPISIQDHGNPVRFRNIWVRELPASDRS